MARGVGKESWQGELARRAGEESWQGELVKRVGKESWQGELARRAGKESWRRELARRAGEESWQGELVKRVGKESWQGERQGRADFSLKDEGFTGYLLDFNSFFVYCLRGNFKEEDMDPFNNSADALDLYAGALLDDKDLYGDEPASPGATIGPIDPDGTDCKVGEVFSARSSDAEPLDGSPTAAEAAFMRSLGWRDGGEHKYPDIQEAPPVGRIPFLIGGSTQAAAATEDPKVSRSTEKKQKRRRNSPARRKVVSYANTSPVKASPSSSRQKTGALSNACLDSKEESKRQAKADRKAELKGLIAAARSKAKTRNRNESVVSVSGSNVSSMLAALADFTRDEPDRAVGRFNAALQALLGKFKGKQKVTLEFEKKMMDSLIGAQVRRFTSELKVYYEEKSIMANLTGSDRRIIEKSDWLEDQTGIFKEGLKAQIELGRLTECSQREKKQTYYDFSGDMRPEAVNMMVMAQKIAYSRYIDKLSFLSEERLEIYLQGKFSELHSIIEQSNVRSLFDFAIEVLEFNSGVVATARESLADLAFKGDGSFAEMQVNFVLGLLDVEIQKLLTESSPAGVELICSGGVSDIREYGQSDDDDDGYSGVD